jgi:GT2 family glycosyltransferase
MKASIIIPVWKGATVIEQCLNALFSDSTRDYFEVICVDNASSDDSADRIARSFPQVRLIRQPVNLGFSGGINAGVEAANGDIFILLNQDCIVLSGWLAVLMQALQDYPQYGLIGSTILNPDGSINHIGAVLDRPEIYGRHLTAPTFAEVLPGQPETDSLSSTAEDKLAVVPVDYATGAALAIRRSVWSQVGHFDEGFYPAYFEDVDYAYRARRKGIQTGCALAARVQHLFSSREWETAPLRHAVITHTSRYRFVCKHLAGSEIVDFFDSENNDLQAVQHLNHAFGRLVAARTTLRTLNDILERRRLDLDENLPSSDRSQLQSGFAHIFRESFHRGKQLAPEIPLALDAFAAGVYLPEGWQRSLQLRREYNQREHELLELIFFRSPDDLTPESTLQRLTRRIFKRLPSRLSGRDHRLWSELLQVQRAHIELLSLQVSLLEMLAEDAVFTSDGHTSHGS